MDKILGELLMAILGGKQERPVGPSPVEGFDKIALLGKGGMGEVWKVRENKTGKLYALKTMLPQIAGDKKARDMFLREAKLTEFLDHENVVRTYKTGFSNNVYYILMDICEGGSVDDLMKRYGGKLSLNLGCRLRSSKEGSLADAGKSLWMQRVWYTGILSRVISSLWIRVIILSRR